MDKEMQTFTDGLLESVRQMKNGNTKVVYSPVVEARQHHAQLVIPSLEHIDSYHGMALSDCGLIFTPYVSHRASDHHAPPAIPQSKYLRRALPNAVLCG